MTRWLPFVLPSIALLATRAQRVAGSGPAAPTRELEGPLFWQAAQARPKGDRAREIDYLARTMWGEARGETTLGRLAVAHVILTRRDKRAYGWPDTVEGVVTQRYQFEPWGTPTVVERMKALGPQDPLFATIWNEARAAYDGETADPTRGADHFVASWLRPPSWLAAAIDRSAIGGHVFARLT